MLVTYEYSCPDLLFVMWLCTRAALLVRDRHASIQGNGNYVVQEKKKKKSTILAIILQVLNYARRKRKTLDSAFGSSSLTGCFSGARHPTEHTACVY